MGDALGAVLVGVVEAAALEVLETAVDVGALSRAAGAGATQATPFAELAVICCVTNSVDCVGANSLVFVRISTLAAVPVRIPGVRFEKEIALVIACPAGVVNAGSTSTVYAMLRVVGSRTINR